MRPILFDGRDANRIYVALLRAQGDILEQIEKGDTDKDKLKEEYSALEKIALNIQRNMK